MKKSKIFSIIYIVIFICMIASLSLLMPFVKSDMNKEKRNAAAFPKLYEKGKLNKDYFDDLTDYFSDNFAFRQQLSTADAVIKANIFSTSNQERVVLGKEGWLFYSESMHDYLGEDVMSDRGINNAARVLYLLQENCEMNQRQFLFAVAPNKNSLYPQYMPDNYLKTSSKTNYDKLRDEMTKQDVNFVDLHKAFLEDDRIMYHRLDSHWNNEGAAFAVDLMLDSLGKEHYDYTSEPYVTEASHRGDLYNILYPSLNELDDNVIYEREHVFSYVNDVKSVEDPIILTVNEEKEGSLVMLRDSYGNASLPYIADEYGRGFFTKGQPADFDLVSGQGADTVIYEIVERNIPWLIEYVPYMEAPIREFDESVEYVESNTSITIEDKGNRYLIYGNVDEAYTDDDSFIYVGIVLPDGERRVYEAFPASYEKVGNVSDAYYAYGAYINKDGLSNDFEVEIITRKDAKWYGIIK